MLRLSLDAYAPLSDANSACVHPSSKVANYLKYLKMDAEYV